MYSAGFQGISINVVLLQKGRINVRIIVIEIIVFLSITENFFRVKLYLTSSKPYPCFCLQE